ncbi:MAG TPA: hypothetical protein PLS84_06455, partial [Salinivirgaceae bacterium]|nr:hypothetical protein [Salinivirgaceae bacterium]
MIANYISELLETNNRVIVPDFGAFMVKLEAGKRKVTFNDFLKYNDGLLINHVASKEKISKDDAFKKVREFAKELIAALKTNQKFPIASIGSLVRDERGGIQFVPGDESQTETPVKEEAGKTPAESQKVQDEPVKLIEKAEDKTEEKPPVVPPTAQGKSTTPTPQATQVKPGAPVPPTQQAKPTVKPGTPPPPPGRGPTTTKKPKGKNKTATVLIVIGIIVVLGVAGGLFYLNYDEWTGKAERERLAQEKIEEEKRRELELLAQAEKEKEAQRIQDSIRAEEEAAKQKLLNQKKYYL